MDYPVLVPRGLTWEDVPDESVNVEEQVIEKLERARVWRALKTLPRQERLTLCWRHGIACEPLSHREIARRLNVSPGTVINLERRAEATLRERLPTAA